MKKQISLLVSLFSIIIILFWNITLYAQNSYQNAFAQVLSLDTCGVMNITDTNGFEVGDKAIIIQMKGATINETNTPAFGSILSLKNAGLFEIITIDTIIGNFITTSFKPINKYDFGGYVQLVSFKYNNLVNINQEIRATPWNGRTGGIIAINAGVLNIDANINADAAGFRGGSGTSPINTCNGLSDNDAMFYPNNSWRSSSKGEGIAEFTVNKEFGRGAQSNGGGGGNDHNAGGGGGGLYTAGGSGGINTENGFFNCKGKYPGIGGISIQNNSFDRIYLGGGGGAGHANNGILSTGGNGGGIVIIVANQINQTTGKITANGGNCKIVNGDGGGGGGSGGTVIIQAKNTNQSLIIDAKGGLGTDVENNGSRCFGPGGGGAGGGIISTKNMTANTVGGLNGNSINGTCGANTSNDATKGSNGIDFIIANFKIPESTTLPSLKIPFVSSTSTDTICRGAKAIFSILVQTNTSPLTYQWYVDKGNGYEIINDDTTYVGTKKIKLEIQKYNDNFQNYNYRCIISTSCGNARKTLNVEPFNFKIAEKPSAKFTTTIASNTIIFNNNSTNANAYLWKFGDGTTSTLNNPTHTFTINNTIVQLIVFSTCGNDTFTQSFTFGSAPIPSIVNSAIIGCNPLIINFVGAASGLVDTWSWKFPGGNPTTSTDQNPRVVYFQPGVFDVELITTNSIGTNSIKKTNFVTVNSTILPSFDISLVGKTITLTNYTVGTDQFIWNFGDGTVSNDKNPIHTYAYSGDYNITLLINKAGCSTSITKSVSIRISSTEKINNDGIQIFPNPFEDKISIIMEKWNSDYRVNLYNYWGQIVFSKEVSNPMYQIDAGNILSNGVYFIEIDFNNPVFKRYYKKIIKISN